MSHPCPEALATVAYLYGEHGSDQHALHVASCPECSAIAAEHEAVAGAFAAGFAVTEARSAVVVALPPRRARYAAVGAFGSLVALAAAALVVARLVVGAARAPEPPATDPLAVAVPADTTDAADAVADAGLDVALDDLDLALASLELEPL